MESLPKRINHNDILLSAQCKDMQCAWPRRAMIATKEEKGKYPQVQGVLDLKITNNTHVESYVDDWCTDING